VIHHRLKRLFAYYYTCAVMYTDMVIEKLWLIAYYAHMVLDKNMRNAHTTH
jgi:hypothetical protein